jgi:histidinol-phosphate aminotransferase
MAKAMRLPKGAVRPRPAVLGMAPYSPPTAGRSDKLRLDFNENTVGCSPRVIEFLRRRLDAADLAVYPEYGEAREAVAQFFGMPSDHFLFTNGTDEAIQVFINTYVDDGQEVLLMRPAYAMYRFYAEVAGARVREVDFRPPNMEFPLQEVLDAITPETRAILLANPNNPTGTGMSLLAIERILKRARKAAVFIDEAYFEFSGVTALPHVGSIPNLFVSRTFSKVYGMAALRLGCLFSHPANVAYLHKAQSPYSVNALAVLAAQEAVRDTGYIEHYVAEVLAARELLVVGLERLGIPFVPSAGNFVLGNFGRRAVEVRDALRAQGILVRDRSYEIPGHVRMTVGTREQTRRLLEALARVWQPAGKAPRAAVEAVLRPQRRSTRQRQDT